MKYWTEQDSPEHERIYAKSITYYSSDGYDLFSVLLLHNGEFCFCEGRGYGSSKDMKVLEAREILAEAIAWIDAQRIPMNKRLR